MIAKIKSFIAKIKSTFAALVAAVVGFFYDIYFQAWTVADLIEDAETNSYRFVIRSRHARLIEKLKAFAQDVAALYNDLSVWNRRYIVALFLALFLGAIYHVLGYVYALWAVFLFIQNVSFTYVSRARNSGSVARHFKASIFSNGIYLLNWLFTYKLFMAAMTQTHGYLRDAGIILFYALFTVSGSIFAHFQSMKSEKGLSAVGASKKIAQFTKDEGDEIRRVIGLAKQEMLTAETFLGGLEGVAILNKFIESFHKQQARLKELMDNHSYATPEEAAAAGQPVTAPVPVVAQAETQQGA